MAYEEVNDGQPLSWDEFEKIIKQDIQDYKKANATGGLADYHSPWIYRGQSNAQWDIETTYERYLKNELGVEKSSYNPADFYGYLGGVIPAINSLTNHKFKRFKPNEIQLSRHSSIPQYELICFARHHGFPTPILDWTYSYYIAAFFAFENASKDTDVAIFAFKEWNGDGRGGWVGASLIETQGPYVETHHRHYRQQGVYTICHAETEKGKVVFMKHIDAVENNEENHRIKKFVIRHDQKNDVLEMLYSMNINHYTLFGSDESLMRSLAYREIVLGGMG